MAFRSLWMAAWLMAGVKTQTFGPNAATFASGQIDADVAAAGAAGVAWAARDGAAANPAPAARATAARARAVTAGAAAGGNTSGDRSHQRYLFFSALTGLPPR